MTAAAVDRDFGFRFPVLSLLPSSEFCAAICVRAVVACVSAGLLGFNRSFFIGGGRSFVPATTWGFAMVYRRITANREWIVNMADGWEENQTITFTSNQYGTVFLPIHRKLYPALSPRRRRMAPSSRSRTIYVGNGRNHIGKQSDLHKLYPNPSPYKSFAELFQKRPFPSFPPYPLVPRVLEIKG